MGSTSSSTGKAINQDSAQALGHSRSSGSPQPTPRQELMNETMQVISSDRKNGINTPA